MTETTPTPPVNPAPTTVAIPSPLEGQVLSSLGEIVTTAEAGYTTSEFWTKIPVQIIGLLTLLGVIHPAPEVANLAGGVAALVAPEIIYIISRGIRKRGTTK